MAINEITKNVLNFQKSLLAIQKEFGSKTPDCAIVIGSGLNEIVNEFNAQHAIPYSDIPHLPVSNVQGHSGMLHIGAVRDKTVLIFSGRFHSYQGLTNSAAAAPAWISGFWKIPTLIVTNAAGGISSAYEAGSMVLLRDHLFLQPDNPLRGVMLPEWENPFVDMTQTYDVQMQYSMMRTAKELGLKLFQGIYACIPGPTYETPAEIEMFRSFGADMVGMSTIPEVIVARKMGMKVLGLSVIANMAAGLSGKEQKITHQEVLHAMQASQGNVGKLLSTWLENN